MAKDAKGHGSETKNAGDHIRDAASNALKNGPSHDSVRASLQDAAAAELLRIGGNPKSAPVATHPAHAGPGGRNPANSSEERARIYGQRLSKPLASDPVHRTSPIDGQYFKRK